MSNTGSLSWTWFTSSFAPDIHPPTIQNWGPSCLTRGIDGSGVFSFELRDNSIPSSGVLLSSIQVEAVIVTPSSSTTEPVVVNGVVQSPWSGSVTPSGTGFDVSFSRNSALEDSTIITFLVDATDQAVPPNVMPQASCQFATTFPDPVCTLAETSYYGVLGTIVQLDARKSKSPDNSSLTFIWKFLSVPVGSLLNADVGVENPDTFIPLRENLSAMAFIPDAIGAYVVELTVDNGGRTSSCTALIRIGLTLVPCGEGIVPDAKFIWSFLSSFWNLVEDREMFQLVWSAVFQVVGAELTRLWSYDYDKSLETIQSTVLRRWVQFPLTTEIVNKAQTVIVGNTTAGLGGVTGPALGVESAVYATVLSTNPGPYNIDLLTLKIGVDSTTYVTTTFNGVDPISLSSVVSQINAAVGFTVAYADGGYLRIRSLTEGTNSKIEIIGGTALSVLGFAEGDFSEGTYPGKTRVFRVPYGDPNDPYKEDFSLIDVDYGARGRIININGTGHVLSKVYNEGVTTAAFSSVLKFDGTTFTDATAESIDEDVNTTFWDANGDYIYVGYTSPFFKLIWKMTVEGGAGVLPVWEYSDGSGGWLPFAPVDGTVGFTQNGNVTFTALNVPGWASQEDGDLAARKTLYWIRIQRTGAPLFSYEKILWTEDDFSYVTANEDSIDDGQRNIPYSIPHLIHVPGVDFEHNGVQSGDTLVLLVERADSGLSAELYTQVVVVKDDRIGFEFSLDNINAGEAGVVDHGLFRQLVQDLKIISPASADIEIAAVAEAFLQVIPIGVNLSTRPFSVYHLTVKGLRVIHNTSVKIDDLIVGIPCLQEHVREGLAEDDAEAHDGPPYIICENKDYVIDGGYLVFEESLYSAQSPAPLNLWAECVHVDNTPAIERNFGRVVGLSSDDLASKSTRAPYLSAVRGLWYAIMGSPTISNLRLAMNILMGLPFTEKRGVVIANSENFTRDVRGHKLGRLLIEDLDQEDKRTSFRRFYYYPMELGLEVNPSTGEVIKVDDVVDAYIPLSKGILVDDYITDPTWWMYGGIIGQEVKKFHTFRAQLDTDTGVFDINDLIFTIQFLRVVKPVWANFAAVVLNTLEDDVLTPDDEITGTEISLRFYDNTGPWGSLEATVRADDRNQQGFTLWRSDGRPFSTRSLHVLKDVTTYVGLGGIEAASATGFSSYRIRTPGTVDVPTVGGDLLILWAGQPGAGEHVQGAYEFYRLGTTWPELAVAQLSDPSSWTAIPLNTVYYNLGNDLKATIVRRSLNPVIQGNDLSTQAPDTATSATAAFVTNSVALDDRLIIEDGSSSREFRVLHTNAQVTPRVYADPPNIKEDEVRLAELDGSSPGFIGTVVGLAYRVVRPSTMHRRVERCKVTVGGGDLWVECRDWGAATEVPFDVFTPGMADPSWPATINVSNANDPNNDGDYTVLAYENAGKVKIESPTAKLADVLPTAIVTISWKFLLGFERAEELSPGEVFDASVV